MLSMSLNVYKPTFVTLLQMSSIWRCPNVKICKIISVFDLEITYFDVIRTRLIIIRLILSGLYLIKGVSRVSGSLTVNFEIEVSTILTFPCVKRDMHYLSAAPLNNTKRGIRYTVRNNVGDTFPILGWWIDQSATVENETIINQHAW